MRVKDLKKPSIFKAIVLFCGLFFAFSAKALALDYPDIFGIDPAAGVGSFVSYVYVFAAGIAGVTALTSFVYAGVQYILSAAKPGLRSAAKERMLETLLGMGLIFGASTLFYTVNPALVEIEEPEIPANLEPTAAPSPDFSLPLGEITFFFDNPPPSSPGSTPPTVDFTSGIPVSVSGLGPAPTPISIAPITVPTNPIGTGPSTSDQSFVSGSTYDQSLASGATVDQAIAQGATSSYTQAAQQAGVVVPTPAPAAEFRVIERVETTSGIEWDNIEGTNIYCPSGPDTSRCTAVVNQTTHEVSSYTCPPGIRPVLLTCEDLLGTGANSTFQNIDFLPLVRSMQNKGGKIYISDMYHGCTDCDFYSAHFTFAGVSNTDKNTFLNFFYNDKAVYQRVGFLSTQYVSGCTRLLLTEILSTQQTCVTLPSPGGNACAAQYCAFTPPTNQVVVGPTSVTLAWISPNVPWAITGYTVTRYDGSIMDDPGTLVASVGLQSNYTDSGLAPNRTYTYVVAATSSESCTDASGETVACRQLAMQQDVTTLAVGTTPVPPTIQQCGAQSYCYIGTTSAGCSTHAGTNGPVHYTIDSHCVQQ